MDIKENVQTLTDDALDTSGGFFEAWPCKWTLPQTSDGFMLEVSGITPDQSTIIGGVKRHS